MDRPDNSLLIKLMRCSLIVDFFFVCRWNKKPLKNRGTVGFPLAGRLAEATRRGAMLLTHALMGFGKDPPTTTTPS